MVLPTYLKRLCLEKRLGGGLARSALRAFGIKADFLHVVSRSENVVFRVVAGSASYALRIHPLSTKDKEAVSAEIAWLRSLRSETSLIVPEPVPGLNGAWVQDVVSPWGRQIYQCVLFRWISGEALGGRLSPDMIERAGAFMAHLHRHALESRIPSQLRRPRIEWKELRRWLDHDDRTSVLSPQDRLLGATAARLLLEFLETSSFAGDFGLIHRDLHPWNYLINGTEIAAIDFDDCQFAPFLCDIAVPLSYLDDRADYQDLKANFINGYASIRAMPAGYEEDLNLFMVARSLYMIDWILGWSHLRWNVYALHRLKSQFQALRRRLP